MTERLSLIFLSAFNEAAQEMLRGDVIPSHPLLHPLCRQTDSAADAYTHTQRIQEAGSVAAFAPPS